MSQIKPPFRFGPTEHRVLTAIEEGLMYRVANGSCVPALESCRAHPLLFKDSASQEKRKEERFGDTIAGNKLRGMVRDLLKSLDWQEDTLSRDANVNTMTGHIARVFQNAFPSDHLPGPFV
jgi:hypothetical protein